MVGDRHDAKWERKFIVVVVTKRVELAGVVVINMEQASAPT